MTSNELVLDEVDRYLISRLARACRLLGVAPAELRERLVARLREVRVTRSVTQVTRFVSDKDGIVFEQVTTYSETRQFIELAPTLMLPPGPIPPADIALHESSD